jgi:hypothetical protein
MENVTIKLDTRKDGSLRKASMRVAGMRAPIIVRPTPDAMIVCPLTLTDQERQEAVEWVVGAYADYLGRLLRTK